MRNLLTLLAAFTLSTSTAVTAVACGTPAQTTGVIFDWQQVMNGKYNETSADMLQFLLDNTDTGMGQTLYKDIVDYISLSILKTNTSFANDYQFAKQSVENQIRNIQDSLRAKYGRKWETQWKNFLKEPAQGGDGQTGSYQRYFDVLLKGKANTIVNQYYVGDNYHNYQYYSSTEVVIWLNDIFTKLKSDHWSLARYEAEGTYGNKVWIVALSFYGGKDIAQAKQELEHEITEVANSVDDISLSYKVAKTKNDQPLIPGDNYLVDPSTTIQGLLSNQQSKIAQVWMKNQGPIWTRQIVVPFKGSAAKENALKEDIKLESFDQNQLRRVLSTINDPNLGFEGALKADMADEIKNVTSSTTSGDLGLVTLNSDPTNIKASFSYYLYRYVTSAQGIGQRSATTEPYQLPEYQYKGASSDLETLIQSINRQNAQVTANHTSRYNDLVWMKDSDKRNLYSGANGNQVAAFIDGDGIHFIQTQGITYASAPSQKSLQDSVVDYTQLISNPTKRKDAQWSDVQDLVNRPGGLANVPYLNFLQTQYLLWNTRSETAFFDLNSSLSKFTSGASDTSSEIWWDYILFFDNNISKIHWNISDNEEALASILKTKVETTKPRIDNFIKSMRTWFLTTFQRRWNWQQGIVSTDTLIKNINDLNKTWSGPDYQFGPPARLDPDDIQSYLSKVAAQTIWYYDPNSIQK